MQQDKKRKTTLDEASEKFTLMRGAFTSVFEKSRHMDSWKRRERKAALHLLGPAMWEVEFTPEEKKYSVLPEKVHDSTHKKIQALLPQLYGAPVYCASEAYIQNTHDIHLLVKNEDSWEEAGSIDQLEVGKLKSHAKPSPFGNLSRMETVYDKTVRDALEIREFKFNRREYYYREPSEEGTICLVSESEISQAVQHMFKRNDLVFLPQKINIYSEGGFFKPHTDTPTDPEKTIGSLVVMFPSKFEGGEFVITHNNKEHVFNMAKHSSYEFYWVAFYTDCIHEVKPVTSGTRITVTYSIDIDNNKKDILDENDDEEEDSEEDSDENPLTRPAFLQSAKTSDLFTNPIKQEKALDDLAQVLKNAKEPAIGFVLDHKYTHSALELGVLKGTDRILAERLQKDGFSLKFQSVLYQTHLVASETSDLQSESRKNVYSWTEDDLNFILGNGPKPVHEFKNVPFFRVGPLGTVMDEETILGAENTGNECRDSEYQKLYWNAAMIAKKPTWWTYARLLWIAKVKNSDEECALGRLPADLLKVITELVKSDSSEENSSDEFW